jgi:hypothetical protein
MVVDGKGRPIQDRDNHGRHEVKRFYMVFYKLAVLETQTVG